MPGLKHQSLNASLRLRVGQRMRDSGVIQTMKYKLLGRRNCTDGTHAASLFCPSTSSFRVSIYAASKGSTRRERLHQTRCVYVSKSPRPQQRARRVSVPPTRGHDATRARAHDRRVRPSRPPHSISFLPAQAVGCFESVPHGRRGRPRPSGGKHTADHQPRVCPRLETRGEKAVLPPPPAPSLWLCC